MKSPLAGHGYSVTRLKTTCPRRNVLVSLNEQKWVILGECRGGRSQSRRRLGLATRESPVEHWRSWCPALRCCHPKYRHSRDGVRRPRGRTNWPRCRAVDRRISFHDSRDCNRRWHLPDCRKPSPPRSEEHTSELQS